MNENTKISMGFLIAVMSILIGFVGWLTNIYSDTQAHGKAIDRIELEQTELKQDIKEILINTNQIKGQLDQLTKEK